ncbi:hypothetical protein ACWG0P_15355 [Amedibacillus sp. YH-ame6]
MKYSQLQFEDLVMENSTECEGKSQVYNSSLESSSNNTNKFVVKEQM